MLEVEISQIATYPTSLRLGCVVRYGKDGPVRFASAYVNDDVLTPEVLADLLQWVVRQTNRALDAERGDKTPLEEPLF